jgi:hypothetical protein
MASLATPLSEPQISGSIEVFFSFVCLVSIANFYRLKVKLTTQFLWFYFSSFENLLTWQSAVVKLLQRLISPIKVPHLYTNFSGNAHNVLITTKNRSRLAIRAAWLQLPLQIRKKCTFFLWRCNSTRVMASSFLRFLDHTQRRITVGRTPLDEWSARRRDLYLTKYNTHNIQTSMPPVGFESTISAGERPHTYALDRAATGTGYQRFLHDSIFNQNQLLKSADD